MTPLASARAHLTAGAKVCTATELRGALTALDHAIADHDTAWRFVAAHRAEIAALMAETARLRLRLASEPADVPADVAELRGEAEAATRRAVVAEDRLAELTDLAVDARRELDAAVQRAALAEAERDEAVERAVAAELALHEMAGDQAVTA